jgi:hypothetical protein
MRIKIESNREYNNKEIQKKNESIEGQPLKESFVSLSSKDAFNTSKNRANNNNFIPTKKINNSNNKKASKPHNSKKNLNNNNIYNNNQPINNNIQNNSNNNIKKKKKKKQGGKSKTIKVESKIKDLIQKDKTNFINTGGISTNNFNELNNNQVYALPMNAMDELGSLRSNNDIPTKTTSDSLRLNIGGNKICNNINNNINNNEINNININNNFNSNITTITSLEDKLNGLTLKLSKLNESINNNKKKLSAYSNNDQFPLYNNIDLKEEINEKENNSPFINIGLGNTVLDNLNNLNDMNNKNIKLNNGINNNSNNIGKKKIDFNSKLEQNNFDENKIINDNNNLNNENDEDYLGEEQLNL